MEYEINPYEIKSVTLTDGYVDNEMRIRELERAVKREEKVNRRKRWHRGKK